MDFDTAAREFIEELVQHSKSTNTVAAYRADLRVFRQWCEWHVPTVIDDISTLQYAHIQAHLSHDRVHDPLSVTPSRKNPDPIPGLGVRNPQYADRTFQRKLVVLRVFCTWAESKQYLPQSPFPEDTGVKSRLYLGTNQTPPIYLSEGDMMRLWRAILTGLPFEESWERCRDRAMFGLMITAGVLVNELCRLSLADGEKLVHSEGDLVITRSTGQKRVVVVPDRVVALIDTYLRIRPSRPECPVLFLSTYTSLNSRIVQRRLREYTNMAGLLPTVTPYTLRHTFAMAMFGEGLNVREVQQLLGHKSELVTAQTYGQLLGTGPHRKVREAQAFKNL